MRTMNAAQITELHATHTRKGAGYAPPLDECLAAARRGRLYDVDTQSAGHDCLTIADSDDAALDEVARHAEGDEIERRHGGDAVAWARSRRWSAARISFAFGGRLSDLDPREVGRAAVSRVLDRLSAWAIRLSPAITVDVHVLRHGAEGGLRRDGAILDADSDGTDLAATVGALTEYAQKGAPVWDWTDDEMAADAMLDAVSTLATDALGTEGGLAEVLLGHQDRATDPVRLVLTAAWARVSLSRNEDVTAAQLGALAGLHPSRVRALRGAGEIPGWESEGNGRGATGCPPKAARRWLASRGVAGFGA